MFCTKPPACLLVKLNRPQSAEFDNLEPSTTPVFPLERSVSLKGFSIRRKQVPMCPAFCLTDYKVQGSTLTEAMLDLKNDPTRRGWDAHRKFCSTCVQLSRLQLKDFISSKRYPWKTYNLDLTHDYYWKSNGSSFSKKQSLPGIKIPH
jgi:hypothetical protein